MTTSPGAKPASPAPVVMTHGLTILFAVAVGAAVGNLYWVHLWSAGGWTAITAAGIAASLFALSVWASRPARRARRPVDARRRNLTRSRAEVPSTGSMSSRT